MAGPLTPNRQYDHVTDHETFIAFSTCSSLASEAHTRPQHGSHPVSARGELGLNTLAHFGCAYPKTDRANEIAPYG